ncbi:MAG: hypothetical protein AAF329_00475 [Cyanobacteria bacterium P01_A01_bin.17]
MANAVCNIPTGVTKVNMDVTPEGKRNLGAWIARCRTDSALWSDALYRWAQQHDALGPRMTQAKLIEYLADQTGYDFMSAPDSKYPRWLGEMERWSGSKPSHRGSLNMFIIEGFLKTGFLYLPSDMGEYEAGPVKELRTFNAVLANFFNPMDAFN